jgi:hypothetical protein
MRVVLFSASAVLIVSIAAILTVPHTLEFLPRGDTAEIATAVGALLVACLVSAGIVWAAPWEELRWARRNPIVGYGSR